MPLLIQGLFILFLRMLTSYSGAILSMISVILLWTIEKVSEAPRSHSKLSHGTLPISSLILFRF